MNVFFFFYLIKYFTKLEVFDGWTFERTQKYLIIWISNLNLITLYSSFRFILDMAESNWNLRSSSAGAVCGSVICTGLNQNRSARVSAEEIPKL